jgi:type I restriction enzyme, S subunit
MSLVALEDVLESLESGARPAGGVSADSGEIPSLGGEHLSADGGFDFTSVKRIPRNFFESIRGGRVAPRDILVVKDGATTGKTSFVGEDFPFPEAAVNEHVFCVRVDQSKAFPEYVFHFLRSPFGQKAIGLDFRGATVGGISRDFAKKVRLPLPPLPEQRRIAEILDKADGLRAKRRAALAQLDTLTQSIFLDMFGDPATNPRGWPIVPFAKLGENQDSFRVPVKASDRGSKKGEFPYYGASGIIDRVDEFIFDGERLLIGEDGANLVARTTPVAFIARGKYWVNNHAHVIADNGRADLRFLESFVERTDLKPFLSGTAQPKLNRGNLDRIPVPLPPLVLQREFAQRLAATEVLRASHRESTACGDMLFNAVQHRAFLGDLWVGLDEVREEARDFGS